MFMTLNPVPRIRNWIGRAKGYSGCYHCRGTWNWKKHHNIPYREGSSMFPLCRECFEKLDAKTIIDYCKRLMAYWKTFGDFPGGRPGALGFDEKKAMKTIRDYVKEVKR